jgi:hypothetical protein
MRAVEPMLTEIRSDYRNDPDLTRAVLNATSWFEASLAVGVLSDAMPARTLVKFANLREAIKELPRCPLPMRTDFEGLARTWSLERDGMAWTRRFDHSAGEYSIALLGEGNYVYDIVIRIDGRTLMLMPDNAAEDFINPDAIDLMMERPDIFSSVVDLTQAMGLPFYPMFYMSLEDWQHEYATAVFTEVISDFDRVRHELPASVLPKPAHKPKRPRSHKKKAAAAS